MSTNLRVYIRSIQRVLFDANPLMATILQLKTIFRFIEETPRKPKDIKQNIFENKTKLDKTKMIIEQNNKYSRNSSSINFIR